jgi:tetratricopeptide (TPR) repeat protein
MTPPHTSTGIIVRRTAELEELEAWVAQEPSTPTGRAALLVGRSGMGKTFLLRQFEELCRHHPGTRWYLQSEPCAMGDFARPQWERWLSDAQSLARGGPTQHSSSDRKLLAELLRGIPGIGDALAYLLKQAEDGWKRYLEYLSHLSKRLVEDDERFILVIDPQESVADVTGGDWVAVAQALPPATRLIIAQRPDDALAADRDQRRRFQIIPHSELMAEFTPEQVTDYYANELDFGRLHGLAADWPAGTRDRLAEVAYDRYQGYPIAHGAVARLLFEEKPEDPLSAVANWPPEVAGLLDMLFNALRQQGEDRHRAMLVLHLIGLPAPLEIWAQASGLAADQLNAALGDARFEQLLEVKQEDGQRRFAPFHALFAERLERELADMADFVQSSLHNIWATIKPQLDPELMQQSQPPEFALRATTPLVSRFDGIKQVADVMNHAVTLKRRLGWLDDAVADIDYMLNRPDCTRRMRAAGYCDLGNIHLTRGDLGVAERMHRQALAIDEQLGRREGMANSYGNLGNVYRERRDLERAEEMYRQALAIELQHGRREGVAQAYGSLGNVYLMRSNLDRAEEMYRQALAIQKQLDLREGMAIDYSNLGIVYEDRGDLSRAESMYRRALTINEQLDKREGMAINYGNLGSIYLTRGDVAKARQDWTKSRDLYAELGADHMVARVQGWLDSLDDYYSGTDHLNTSCYYWLAA